jgi:hypothetical protein
VQVILVNFRKEILPFVPRKEGVGHGHGGEEEKQEEADSDCSDVLVVSDSTAIVAHNEDGNVALLGHTYVRALLCQSHRYDSSCSSTVSSSATW